jgi:hypothetical protein
MAESTHKEETAFRGMNSEEIEKEMHVLKGRVAHIESVLCKLKPPDTIGMLKNQTQATRTHRHVKNISVRLKKFALDMMDDTSMVLIIGKRASGRTTLIRDILHNFRDIPVGTVVNRSEQLEPRYGDIIPEPFIHYNLATKGISDVVRRQHEIINKEKTDNDYIDVDTRGFLVMDNSITEANWQDSMKEVFVNGKKLRLLRIISESYIIAFKKENQDLVDWVFMFGEGNSTFKKRLYDRVGGMFPNQAVFDEVLTDATKDYGCLVIDNRQTSPSGEYRAFWYRADKMLDKTWRTCYDVFWEMDKTQRD